MTLLRDTAWRLKYTPDDGDLVRLFYVPVLRSATRYDRLTGYFSARALALAARGVEGLIVNNGRMRLIVGCTLGEEEVAAIERGESLRDAVERTLIKMPVLSADPPTIDALELVAWMVANGYLDVKLAVPCDLDRRPIRDDSIFHEKTGIIEDKTGDRLAFNGSINETEFGWTRNWESFNAFTSWNDGPRVDEEEASFAKLWADRARRNTAGQRPEPASAIDAIVAASNGGVDSFDRNAVAGPRNGTLGFARSPRVTPGVDAGCLRPLLF